MKRKLLPVLTLLFSVGFTQAAQLSPDGALGRLSEFLPSGAQARFKAPSASEARLVYTATTPDSNGTAYYVFNTPGDGFIIMSADDRLPAVLGFSDNGAFDIDKISPDMKWWLGEYEAEIGAFYTREGADTPVAPTPLKKAAFVDREKVEPLITTRWNQMAPYNNDCPSSYPTGCVATAMAQVMNYHKWPEVGSGERNGVTFENTWYDWDNMIDDYESTNYSTLEAMAVATLMRHCGAAVDMMYTPYASGAYSFNVPVALYTYFGYDEGMTLDWRDYHNMSEWNELVYEELTTNGPIYYSGSSSAGGHAFVCDGYLGNNFFHFNWGWGGYQDGYFLLNALNPATGGTGSYAGGYNSGQTIITGLKKADSVNSDLQKTLLCLGSFVYEEGNTFGVKDDPDGYNGFYNPLGYKVDGNTGLKVTPVDGGEAKYFQGSAFNLDTGYLLFKITANISGLADGDYIVQPAQRYNGEWSEIPVMVGYQRYVNLKVSGGKNSFTNGGVPAELQPELMAGTPATMPEVFGDGAMVFKVTVINTGGGDYNNNLALSLYEKDNQFGGVSSQEKFVCVPGNSSLEVEFVLDTPLSAGLYEVILTDAAGNALIAAEANAGTDIPTHTVRVIESNRGVSANANMVFSDISPNSWTLSGENPALTMTISNQFYAEYTQKFFVKLYDSSFHEVFSSKEYSVSLLQNATTTANTTALEVPLEAGFYYWQIVDAKGNHLSKPYPLMVKSERKEKDGLTYEVYLESAGFASITAPMLSEYSGDVVIPETIDGYQVRQIKADAFTFADELTSISIPCGVKEIETGTFNRASSLQLAGVYNETPPTVKPGAFGDVSAIYIDTYAGGVANLYATSPIWKDFTYSAWNITFDKGVASTPESLLTDPATGSIYAPYHVGYDEALFVGFTVEDETDNVFADIEIDGNTETQEVWRGIWLPALNGKTGTVRFYANHGSGISEVETGADSYNVVSLTGITLLRDASVEQLRQLPSGIYIVNGKKVRL